MSRTDALSAKLRPQLQVVRQRWQQLVKKLIKAN